MRVAGGAVWSGTPRPQPRPPPGAGSADQASARRSFPLFPAVLCNKVPLTELSLPAAQPATPHCRAGQLVAAPQAGPAPTPPCGTAREGQINLLRAAQCARLVLRVVAHTEGSCGLHCRSEALGVALLASAVAPGLHHHCCAAELWWAAPGTGRQVSGPAGPG